MPARMPNAIATPSPAPTLASNNDSVSSWRIMRWAFRSQRRSHGQLVLACGAARQQQDRYVSAADCKQQCHCAKQQIKCPSHPPDDPRVESFHLHFELLGKLFRALPGKLLEQGLKGGVCASFSYAWLFSDRPPLILFQDHGRSLAPAVYTSPMYQVKRGAATPTMGGALVVQLQRPAHK